MKRLVTFDSYADTWDVKDGLSPIRSLAGVRSVELLTAVGDNPRYCVIIDVEDEHDAALAARLEWLGQQNAGYVSQVTQRVFKSVS